MIKNIFFDFDGVLAESMAIKSQAFHDLYLPHGDAVAAAARHHHLTHAGISRHEKFRYCHRHFLKTELEDAAVDALAARFSDLVTQAVIDCPEVPGAGWFLSTYRPQLRCWIISGTPTPELEAIVEARGMRHFFADVCGSPRTKPDWVADLLDTHGLVPAETLFVGDALADLEAALPAGLHFVLRETAENQPLFRHYIGPRIRDIHGLPAFLG